MRTVTPSRSSAARRGEGGFVLPTRALALCVSAVAVAGLVFIAHQGTGADDTATPVRSSTSSHARTPASPAAPSATASQDTRPLPKPVKRSKTLVQVFNNTRVHGLASGVAGKAKAAGWNVTGTDNWYGTIATTTVFYPPNLKDAGQLLARDLGITKFQLAQDPMKMDRLTVILTSDYH